MTSFRYLVLIPLLVLFIAPSVSTGQGNEIGILFVGEPFASQPFNLMISDPLFSVSFVDAHIHSSIPLSTADVKRMVRLYMPRSLHDITSNFDVVILAYATREALGSRYIDLISQSVREAGLALLMAGGPETFGGFHGKTSWGGTSVAELLPTEPLPQEFNPYGYLVLDRTAHELIASIPWNMKDPVLSSPITWDHNVVTLRPGADQLAHLNCPGGGKDPLMVTWEIENRARIFAMTSEISLLSRGIRPWKYHYDFGSNLMIYMVGRPVPQDIQVVHLARNQMLEISRRRSLLVDLLEFSESFGANTDNIMAKMEKMETTISLAERQYLELRYRDALETCEPIESIFEELEKEALRLKDEALIWIYLVEWISVTGTALFCGFVLWTVMVQRRFYRKVSHTRAGDRPEVE